MLQQTVRKAAGGSADIETDLARDVDMPVFKRALKFEPAPADILQIFAEQPDHGVLCDLRTRLVELLVVNQYFSRENESLGPLSRGGESAIEEEFVESEFHGCLVTRFLSRDPWAGAVAPRKCQPLLRCKELKRLSLESLTKIRSCFSTELSSIVLKTTLSRTQPFSEKKKSRPTMGGSRFSN